MVLVGNAFVSRGFNADPLSERCQEVSIAHI